MKRLLTYKLFEIQGFKPHQSMNRDVSVDKKAIEKYFNEVLDKINRNGIDSVSKKEKEFLDSYKNGDQEKVLTKIRKEAIIDDHKIGHQKEWVLRSDNGMYKITLDVVRFGEDEFQLNSFVDGWLTATVNKQQMMDLYDGKLDRWSLDWE